MTKAFNIGKAEANAVVALQTAVDGTTVAVLKDCVAKRGMRSFLAHDCIGNGFFSIGFSSAKGPTEPWTSEMTNSDTGEIVTWFFFGSCFEESRSRSRSLFFCWMKGASGFVPSFFNIAELDKHAHSVSLSGQTSH